MCSYIKISVNGAAPLGGKAIMEAIAVAGPESPTKHSGGDFVPGLVANHQRWPGLQVRSRVAASGGKVDRGRL